MEQGKAKLMLMETSLKKHDLDMIKLVNGEMSINVYIEKHPNMRTAKHVTDQRYRTNRKLRKLGMNPLPRVNDWLDMMEGNKYPFCDDPHSSAKRYVRMIRQKVKEHYSKCHRYYKTAERFGIAPKTVKGIVVNV